MLAQKDFPKTGWGELEVLENFGYGVERMSGVNSSAERLTNIHAEEN
jgi:hypothetical protein